MKTVSASINIENYIDSNDDYDHDDDDDDDDDDGDDGECIACKAAVDKTCSLRRIVMRTEPVPPLRQAREILAKLPRLSDEEQARARVFA